MEIFFLLEAQTPQKNIRNMVTEKVCKRTNEFNSNQNYDKRSNIQQTQNRTITTEVKIVTWNGEIQIGGR